MENATKRLKIIFYGDSICVGQGISIHQGCVVKVAAHLEENKSSFEHDILVINSSVNGRTTRQALEDMPYHVQSQSPDILLLQYGLNDCNHWLSDQGLPRVSLDAFKANLKEMVQRGKNFGVKHVLLINNHPTTLQEDNLPNTGFPFEYFNQKYNEATRILAEELQEDVIFLDIEAHFSKLLSEGREMSHFLLEDGMHLGETGHQVYFDFINPVLKNAIESLANSQKQD